MPEFYTLLSYARLAVADPKATARWYGKALAFHPVAEVKSADGTPQMLHLRRAVHQDLVLVPQTNGGNGSVGQGVTLGFTVEDDLEALTERAQLAGARIVEGPVERPWKAREVVLCDPNGYTLSFSQVPSKRMFSDVIETLIGSGSK